MLNFLVSARFNFKDRAFAVIPSMFCAVVKRVFFLISFLLRFMRKEKKRCLRIHISPIISSQITWLSWSQISAYIRFDILTIFVVNRCRPVTV